MNFEKYEEFRDLFNAVHIWLGRASHLQGCVEGHNECSCQKTQLGHKMNTHHNLANLEEVIVIKPQFEEVHFHCERCNLTFYGSNGFSMFKDHICNPNFKNK